MSFHNICFLWGEKKTVGIIRLIWSYDTFFFFQSINVDVFLISSQKHVVVLIRSASLRHF